MSHKIQQKVSCLLKQSGDMTIEISQASTTKGKNRYREEQFWVARKEFSSSNVKSLTQKWNLHLPAHQVGQACHRYEDFAAWQAMTKVSWEKPIARSLDFRY